MAEIRSFAPHDESRRMEAETREVVGPPPALNLSSTVRELMNNLFCSRLQLGMLQQTDHIHDFIKAVNALLSQRDEDVSSHGRMLGPYPLLVDLSDR